MRDRIINHTIQMFERYGIKGLTTQDISLELGISKRTFYNYFPCKEQLLVECMQFQIERCKLFTQTDGGLVDELLALYVGLRSTNLRNIHRFCCDIEKYYKPVSKILLCQQMEYASICGKKVRAGICQGYIRGEVNSDTVCRAVTGYLTQLFISIGHNYDDIHTTLSPDTIIIFTRGLCTLKGRNYLDQKLKEIAE